MSQIFLLPNHWSNFTLSGLSQITSLPQIQNIIYGNLKYYSLSSNIVTLTPKSFVIPPLVDIGNWNSSLRNSLTMQVNEDASFLASPQRNFVPSSDPYAFGQIASAIGRLFLFAKELNIPTSGTASIPEAISVIKQYLVAWLTNTNVSGLPNKQCTCESCIGPLLPPPDIFHLQRENTWGGIIVPADYYNSILPACYPLGSFGNSFYNDHHFHWGYILYALNCLEYIGEGLSSQYPKQITSLIRDLVNPSSDTFAWKTRHKDWFAGHSWATGNTTEVSRQQESCSEAINGYYGAYLMAERLGRTDLQTCAAVCLNLEILACQNYYYLQAPGSQIGLMNQVHGAGIIFNNSKQFNLDWGMQPDSFAGRSLGIYGIQCIPFTDISKIQIPTTWSNSLPSGNMVTGLAYAVTPTLVTGLCGDSYVATPVYNTSWKQNIAFDVNREGTFWGFVGLKMLAFGSGISNISAQNAYNASYNKQLQFMNPTGQYFPIVKQFDTFSNTLYWLISTGKWTSSGVSSILIDSDVITPLESISTSTSIPTLITSSPITKTNYKSMTKTNRRSMTNASCGPIPIPTPLELLEKSTLRSQGLVNVPTILMEACFNDQLTNVRLALFQIRDNTTYYEHRRLPLKNNCDRCDINEDICLIRGICPEDVKFTELKSDLNVTLVINAPGDSLYSKVNNIGGGVDFSLMLVYAYLKLILSRILYGTFDLKYLTQSYNDLFFKYLAKSRFCNFINLFTQLNILDYNQYFVL
jgi:hypothetical protein